MIRSADEKDTKQIWEAHVASIRQVCSKDYRPDQIEAWSAFQYSHERWANSIKKDHVLVVEIEQCVEGFCHAVIHDEQTSEISGLYLSPKAAGKGFGRQLVTATLAYLKSRGAKRVVIKATKTAIGFYRHMGFIASGPEQAHNIRGAKIECFPMEMTI